MYFLEEELLIMQRLVIIKLICMIHKYILSYHTFSRILHTLTNKSL